MKGFGFPSPPNRPPPPRQIVDLTPKRIELIYHLSRCESLWQEQNFQESLVALKEAIIAIKYLVDNERIQQLRDVYQKKLYSLKFRLQTREEQLKELKIAEKKKRRELIQSSKLKDEIPYDIATTEQNIKWEDVCGRSKVKILLNETVVLPSKFPQLYTAKRQLWRGILLFGPSGVGKTFLANACGSAIDGAFFSLSSFILINKYLAKAQRLIQRIFTKAREKKPSIVFIDDIDYIYDIKTEGQQQLYNQIKAQLYIQIQNTNKDNTGIFFIAAASRPWVLDPFITKLFEKRIYLSLPEQEARFGMLKKCLRDNKHNIKEEEFMQFAKKTENYSCSDLMVLAKNAIYEPVRRLQTATKFKLVNGKYVACRPGEQGEQGNWREYPKDKIDIGIISKIDIQSVLRAKSTVQFRQYEQFGGKLE